MNDQLKSILRDLITASRTLTQTQEKMRVHEKQFSRLSRQLVSFREKESEFLVLSDDEFWSIEIYSVKADWTFAVNVKKLDHTMIVLDEEPGSIGFCDIDSEDSDGACDRTSQSSAGVSDREFYPIDIEFDFSRSNGQHSDPIII